MNNSTEKADKGQSLLKDLGVPFSMTRSHRRRYLLITVDPRRGVVVSAPANTSHERISQFLNEKKDWIFSCLKRQQPQREQLIPHRFLSGERFWYLGDARYLDVVTDTDTECQEAGDRLRVSVSASWSADGQANDIRARLIHWYRRQAAIILSERTHVYAEQLGVYPTQILIRDQKRRWGSCGADGRIRYNWKIMMAPLPVVDYLVVHELCHLKVRNHPPKFWKLVGTVLPDYKDQKAYLRHHGALYEF